MNIKAMKLALEALEAYRPVIVKRHGLTYSVGDKAITSLRQAIEQAEQAQPVAFEIRAFNITQALVKRPDVAQEKADVLERGFGSDADVTIVPLYTAPPRQPLTDEQIEAMWQQYCKRWKTGEKIVINFVDFARAIEAAHGIKEKNT
jgi:hypothetical protein